MKILFAVSEAIPFAASGGLADVGGSLPRAIRNRGNACRVVMPLYDTIAPQYRERMEFVAEFSVQLSWRRGILLPRKQLLFSAWQALRGV